MFEISVLSENCSVYVKETRREILIVLIKISEDHDAVHAVSDQLNVQMFETTNCCLFVCLVWG